MEAKLFFMKWSLRYPKLWSVYSDFLRSPTIASVENVHKEIKNYNFVCNSCSNEKFEVELCFIQRIVTSSLLDVISKANATDVVDHCFQLLKEILSMNGCQTSQSFRTILFSCVLLMYDSKNLTIVRDDREERKLLILEVILILLRNSSRSLRVETLKDQTCHSEVGHAIFVFLGLAKSETFKKLRVAAMEAILLLSPEPHTDNVLFGKRKECDCQWDCNSCSADLLSARSTIASFFPGVLSSSAKLVLGDSKQGQAFTKTSMTVFSSYFSTCLGQSYLTSTGAFQLVDDTGEDNLASALQKLSEQLKSSQGYETESSKSKELAACKPGKETIRRVPEVMVGSVDWLAKVVPEAIQRLEAIALELPSHSHSAVRLQLALSLSSIISSCYRSVPSCVTPCLEALATLAVDTDPSVCAVARDALTRPERVGESSAVGSHYISLLSAVESTLQDRLYRAIKSLPLQAIASEKKLLITMQRLQGCLLLLGPQRSEKFLNMPGVCDVLLLGLSNAIAYDVSDARILLENDIVLSGDYSESVAAVAAKRLHVTAVGEASCRSLCQVTGAALPPQALLASIAHLLPAHRHVSAALIDVFTACVQGYTLNTTSSNDTNKSSRKLITRDVPTAVKERFVHDSLNFICDIVGLPGTLGTCETGALEARCDCSNERGKDNHRSSLIENLDNVYSHLNSVFNPCANNTSLSTASGSCGSNCSSVLHKQRVLETASSVSLIATLSQLVTSSFSPFLQRIMCPLLQLAGDSNILLSEQAKRTLSVVAASLDHKSSRTLIEESFCHYCYPLTVQLRDPILYPKAPQVLKVVLECCGQTSNKRVLDLLQVVMQELIESLDSHHSLQPQQLLVLLRLFVASYPLKLLKPESCEEIDSDTPHMKSVNKNKEIEGKRSLSSFLKWHHDKTVVEAEEKKCREAYEIDEINKRMEQFEGEEKSTGDEIPHDSVTKEDSEKEIPREVQLVVDVLERCCFLLHSREREVAMTLLDTIELGCQALQLWENSQLPVLHKVWKPLMLRIKDTDTVVSLRALTVCCVMVDSSGDFLRKRCLKELLPLVNSFLQRQSSVSLSHSFASAYLFSPAYSAQVKLLEIHYPRLIAGLNLGSREIIDALYCCVDYLDTRQPRQLEQAGAKLVDLISMSHPEQVWLTLGKLLPPRCLPPPHSNFTTVRLDGGIRDRNYLSSSVYALFNEVHYANSNT